jgi:uncharacterized integral membrane protein
MKVRVVVVIMLLLGVAVFATVNWAAFNTPTSLSLLVTTVEAPLGAIMLALTALLTLVFVVVATLERSSALVAARRQARELQAQRELAEHAEASRYIELRALLEGRLQDLREQSGQGQTEVLSRLDQLERELREAIEQSGNALAAYIGELDDRLEREEAKERPGGPS